MGLTKHGAHLWKLTRLGVFNCYLIGEEDGELTVIDTGLPGTAPSIVRAAAQIGRPITRIGVTHGHGDHVASLDALVGLVPDAAVFASARTVSFLAGDTALLVDEPQTPIKGGLQTTETVPDTVVADGESVGSLVVMATPGHTPDHISFYDSRDGSVIVGDALQTQGGLAVAGVVNWLFPLPAWATWHLPSAVNSAKAIQAKNPSRLATGHGRVLESPAVQLAEAIAVAERKSRS